jgi:hypothetical protein
VEKKREQERERKERGGKMFQVARFVRLETTNIRLRGTSARERYDSIDVNFIFVSRVKTSEI